jgi:predicted MPP superfamily phosphohydrolase
LIVGAGAGTSILPLRLGAVPDMWLIRLVPGSVKKKDAVR